ncbi:MAG: hypothetical protein HY815_10560, partial [Candidatus Riflebacteria bacterium]|nr:hypothetical protein [Candidatus Riflebacteria bacterium]
MSRAVESPVRGFVPRVLVLALVFLGGVSLVAAQAAPRTAVGGRFIVKTKAGVAPAAVLTGNFSGAAAVAAQAYPGAAAVQRELGSLRLSTVAFPASSGYAEAAKISARKGVEYVAPIYKYDLTRTPNDPSYPSQYHHPLVGCPAAWDVSVGSSSMPIAILDTGTDPDHPDLKASLIAGFNF